MEKCIGAEAEAQGKYIEMHACMHACMSRVECRLNVCSVAQGTRRLLANSEFAMCTLAISLGGEATSFCCATYV
jgi:hypothetical protein